MRPIKQTNSAIFIALSLEKPILFSIVGTIFGDEIFI